MQESDGTIEADRTDGSAEETAFGLLLNEPPPLPRPKREPSVRDVLAGVPIVWGMLLSLIGVGALVNMLLFGAEAIDTSSNAQGVAWPRGDILFSTIADAVCSVSVSWFFMCRRYGREIREGFALRGLRAGRIIRLMSLAVTCAVAGAVFSAMFGTQTSPLEEELKSEGAFALFAFLAVLLAPVEELYYRGFIFPALRNSLGAAWAFLIVTAWFGLLHGPQLGWDWASMGVVTSLGAVCTYLRYRTDSLTPSIVCHVTYNSFLVAMSLLARQVAQ